MTGLIVEAGVYLLILFTPLAFGGVELWALGVVQILCGIVFVSWALGEGNPWRRGEDGGTAEGSASRWPGPVLWTSIGLFALLVGLQIVPLPPSILGSLSPGTHDLYARTVPGYAEGKGFDAADLPDWLLADKADQIPPALASADAHALESARAAASGYPAQASAWRTLSIYPFVTGQRLTTLLCYIGLFAVVSGYFRSRERLTRLMIAVVFAGFSISFLGIIQKMTWDGRLLWIREGQFVNPFGPFVNRNSYAAFAGAVFPLAVCATLGALHKLRRGRTEALPGLLLSGFASVVIAGGICYSLSRGGMIGAALSILAVAAFLVYYGRHGADLVLLGILLAAAAGFLIWIGPEQVVERVETLSEGQSTPSLALRIEAWRRSLSLIADHAALGTGLGTFPIAFQRYAPPGLGWWTTAHNEYLEVVCDTGLLGAALVLAGLVAYLRRVMRPGRFREDSSRYVYAGIVAGMAGLLVHSAVSSNLQVPANGVALVVLGAALQSLVQRAGSHRRSGESGAEGRLHAPGEHP